MGSGIPLKGGWPKPSSAEVWLTSPKAGCALPLGSPDTSPEWPEPPTREQCKSLSTSETRSGLVPSNLSSVGESWAGKLYGGYKRLVWKSWSHCRYGTVGAPEPHSSWEHLPDNCLGSAAGTPHLEHPRASWEAWHGSPPNQER